MREAGLNWWQSKRQSQDRRVWRNFLKDLCPSWVKGNKSVIHDVNWYWQIKKFLKVGGEVNQEKPSCAQWCPIDPFNRSNLYSFPLLRSLKLYVFNSISKAEYVVKSGKLYNYIRLIKRVYTGLLIFRAVAEPRISSKSAKSREIHKNTRNPAKFARNLPKYMSALRIWKLSWLLGLLTCCKLANLTWNFVTKARKQHPKTTRRS